MDLISAISSELVCVCLFGGFRCDISSLEESTQNQNQTGFMRQPTPSHEIGQSENVKAKAIDYSLAPCRVDSEEITPYMYSTLFRYEWNNGTTTGPEE
jgi:hypothetical protein